MNPLVLRDELPPDDTVVVVRGGEMNSEFVRRTATRSFEEFGIWAVSVFVAEGVQWLTYAAPFRILSATGRSGFRPLGVFVCLALPLFLPWTIHTLTLCFRTSSQRHLSALSSDSTRPFQIQCAKGRIRA